MIATLHSAYEPTKDAARPLSVRVLAEALGLQPDYVDMTVKDPLGKEAAITGHGDDLWIRHRSIADTALNLHREQRPGEVRELVARLVRAAVALGGTTSSLDPDLYAVAYLCSRLPDP